MRKKVCTVQIIDTLAEITRFQNRELLEQSLVKTLVEMVDSNEYRLFKVVVPPPEIELLLISHVKSNNDLLVECIHSHKISENLTEGIAHSVDSGEVVTVEENSQTMSNIIYPIFDKQNEIFAVLVQFTQEPHFEDQRIIYGLLKVYSNYMMLLDDSQKDKLTGLLNRETLNEKVLEILVKRSRKGHAKDKSPVRRISDEISSWLTVIDIDYFKRVNDEYGHLFGDEVLILFARFMQDIFREDDFLYRYGGEEFVAIINVFNKEDAIYIFERLRTKMERHEFPRIGNITASFGLVEIGTQEGVKDVIGNADAALYYAKAHGRNRTCVYEDLIANGELQEKKKIKIGNIDLF